VQSEHVFLLFSVKLVQSSSNLFKFDANFFGIWPILNFLRKASQSAVFSSGILALSAFWQEGLSFLRLALHNMFIFLLKHANYRDYGSNILVFAVLIAI
jgi:hypothetical protein